MIRNIRSGALLALAAMIFLSSCISTMKTTIRDDGKQIPPGFGKEESTLLVIRKGKRSYDKYLEKNFEEAYFGKYEIVEASSVDSKKYSDKKKYRYVFDEDKHTVNRSAGSIPDNSTYAMFGVTDRVSGETYKTKHGTGAFSKWMKVYIQALEKARTGGKS
jgi:hypothetical protein